MFIPPRIQVAQQFVMFCQSVEQPPNGPDGPAYDWRELQPLEAATRDAALKLMRDYFLGEVEIENPAPVEAPSLPDILPSAVLRAMP